VLLVQHAVGLSANRRERTRMFNFGLTKTKTTKALRHMDDPALQEELKNFHMEAGAWRFSAVCVDTDRALWQVAIQVDALDYDISVGFPVSEAEALRRVVFYSQRLSDGPCIVHAETGLA
jgi:hypothetical protein